MKNDWQDRVFSPDQMTPSRPRVNLRVLYYAAVVVVAVLVYPVVCLYMGQSRTVYVVNGTTTAYDALINGERVSVAPLSNQTIKVAEGNVTVEVEGTLIPVDDATLTLATPFFTRPFNDTVFVINPDRTAILVVAEAYYGSKAPSQGYGSPPVWLAGRAFYELEEIDYAFEEFPAMLSSGSSSSIRRRVGLDIIPDYDSAMQYFEDELDPESLEDLVRHGAIFNPQSASHFEWLISTLDEDAALEVIEPMLDARPIHTQAHRAFQRIYQMKDQSDVVKKQYDRLLDEDPNDPAHQYLAARLMDDDDEQERRFVQSIEGGLQLFAPTDWLYQRYVNRADVDGMLRMSKLMVELEPDGLHGLQHRWEAMAASGRYDEALQISRKRRAIDDVSVESTLDEISSLVELGRMGDVAGAANRYLTRLNVERYPAAEKLKLQSYIETNRSYMQGDVDRFVAMGRDSTEPRVHRYAAAASDDTEWKRETLAELTSDDFDVALFIAATHLHDGNSVEAQLAIERAITLMSEESAAASVPSRELDSLESATAWLKREATPTPREVDRIILYPTQKKALLLVVGQLNPSLRDHCFSRARQLNFDRRYPYLLIQDICGTGD